MNQSIFPCAKLVFAIYAGVCCVSGAEPQPFCSSELIFPLESWHNHASCLVEVRNGDLLACWFHGSGERTADDVVIKGARLKKGSQTWSKPFLLSDTPGFPDGNPCWFIDPQERLWLFHTTILANTWESALLKVKTSRNYRKKSPPIWDTSDILLVKPGSEFAAAISNALPGIENTITGMQLSEKNQLHATNFLEAMRMGATNKLYQRLGWMTRAHPTLINGRRLLVPLYHDGFSFSLVAITEDWGKTWVASAPIIGAGNIQPSIVQKRDGSLLAYMRDNGPPPNRLMTSLSTDGALTWSPAVDSTIPNPGSGAEVLKLRNGMWVLINNDTETGRHRLAVSLSKDEGKTWPWTRYLEEDKPGPEAGRYHYPSIIESKDGTLHVTYSYHLHKSSLPKDVDGDPAAKSIKHAHFNIEWVMDGARL